MKKILVLILTIGIFLMILAGCNSSQEETTKPTEQEPPLGIEEAYDRNWTTDIGYYKKDVLPDKDMAKAVAQLIFDGIKEEYGKEDYVIQYATYYEKENAWMVHFAKTYKEGEMMALGAGCTIALNKTDGRVMRIFWG